MTQILTEKKYRRVYLVEGYRGKKNKYGRYDGYRCAAVIASTAAEAIEYARPALGEDTLEINATIFYTLTDDSAAPNGVQPEKN